LLENRQLVNGQLFFVCLQGLYLLVSVEVPDFDVAVLQAHCHRFIFGQAHYAGDLAFLSDVPLFLNEQGLLEYPLALVLFVVAENALVQKALGEFFPLVLYFNGLLVDVL